MIQLTDITETYRIGSAHTKWTLLIVAGVAIGVGAVIVTTAVASGTERPRHLSALAPGNIVIITPGDAGSLTMQDVAAIKHSATLVTAVSPVTIAPADVVAGHTDWRTVVYGVGGNYLSMADRRLAGGVPFDKGDVGAHRRFALLGATVASRLFPNRDAFGERVRIDGVPFLVIGVLAATGQDNIVVVPYTTRGSNRLAEIVAATAVQSDNELRRIVRGAHVVRARHA
jgi:putative ABC transport system permease protein